MHKFIFLVCIIPVSFLIYLYSIEQHIKKVPAIEKINIVDKIPDIFDEINYRNSKVDNFRATDFSVRIWQNGHRLKLKGSLFYAKDKNFRLVLQSIFGKESDLGSNEKIFWFWSKRMEPSTLYFAAHDDFYKTRLKTPFNPMYIMDSLGFSNIDYSNSKIVEKENKFIVVNQLKNSIGKQIIKLIFINKLTKNIDGFQITDINGKLEASIEVLIWKGSRPKQILYLWAEENISMIFDFEETNVNIQIDFKTWDLPSIKPVVDMAKE